MHTRWLIDDDRAQPVDDRQRTIAALTLHRTSAPRRRPFMVRVLR